MIGAAAGVVAAAVRYSLPLDPTQLPTLPVVVMLAIVTTFVGVWAGIATAFVGGLLSWYLFFNANSWSLANGAWVPLLGFAIISSVIITTAHLYRSAERRAHARQIARLEAEAEIAQLFAREMSHRLKNALAIAQAIAFQTIGTDTADAKKFAGRLKALADANELLDEHVERPAAKVAEVIRASLAPFGDAATRFDVDVVEASIPAQQVVSLAMALHELATNAIKYGSLSAPGGRARIIVRDRGHDLLLEWVEQGGPPVSSPQSHGFGTRLLMRSGTGTEIDFAESGLRCSVGIRKV